MCLTGSCAAPPAAAPPAGTWPVAAPAVPSTAAAPPAARATASPGPERRAIPAPRAAPAPPPAAPAPSAAGRDLFAELLADLERLVLPASRPTRDYDRAAFAYAADMDGDCLNTRAEVLVAASEVVALAAGGCRVAAGVWRGAWTGEVREDPAALEVDHVVALADAWRSGAWRWPPARQAAFGNDEANLVVATAAENQRKGAAGPAEWTPPLAASRCDYWLRYAATKAAWGLTVNPADHAALAGLQDCPPGESNRLLAALAAARPPAAAG